MDLLRIKGDALPDIAFTARRDHDSMFDRNRVDDRIFRVHRQDGTAVEDE
jgi:hypothetical protein